MGGKRQTIEDKYSSSSFRFSTRSILEFHQWKSVLKLIMIGSFPLPLSSKFGKETKVVASSVGAKKICTLITSFHTPREVRRSVQKTFRFCAQNAISRSAITSNNLGWTRPPTSPASPLPVLLLQPPTPCASFTSPTSTTYPSSTLTSPWDAKSCATNTASSTRSSPGVAAASVMS